MTILEQGNMEMAFKSEVYNLKIHYAFTKIKIL